MSVSFTDIPNHLNSLTASHLKGGIALRPVQRCRDSLRSPSKGIHGQDKPGIFNILKVRGLRLDLESFPQRVARQLLKLTIDETLSILVS